MKTKSSAPGPGKVPPPITLSYAPPHAGCRRAILNSTKCGYLRGTMPEIRKDYATDTWVLFSAARSRRPGAFRNAKSSTPKEECPFCVGHESMTPPEVLAYREGGSRDGPGWRIRCVPNPFPAIASTGEVRHHAEGLFVRVDGVGAHEIIVETPEHDARLASLAETQIAEVLRSYRDRYRALAADPRIKYVLVFKNHGERAGASLSHPHSQLIATPIVPLRILDELEGVRTHRATAAASCLYCDVVASERKAGQRLVAENERFIALAPYAARFPFETWILPKAHETSFEDITDDERTPFARILKDALGRLFKILDDPPFNYYIHTAPTDRKETRYHWHLEITPRLTETAGFERGTGFYINPVMPEDAAAILREGAKAPKGR